MDDETYLIGDDGFCLDNSELIVLTTDKGEDIAAALSVSGIPFYGQFNSISIAFDYNLDYKNEVNEIIQKLTSQEYEEQRQEIKAHRENDLLYFIPAVAKILGMTEGTLRSRPLDIQLNVCRRYAYFWCCDTYTLQNELKRAMLLHLLSE